MQLEVSRLRKVLNSEILSKLANNNPTESLFPVYQGRGTAIPAVTGVVNSRKRITFGECPALGASLNDAGKVTLRREGVLHKLEPD